MLEVISGIVEKVIYHNDGNGFTVLVLQRDEFTIDTVTCNIYSIEEGQRLQFKGEWKVHQKFGKQFAAESYEEVMPVDTTEIEIFLSSRFVDGVGEHLAKSIVDRFGEQTFDIMDNDIERLKEINGIGAKKLEKIKEKWNEQKLQRETILFLQKNGIKTALTHQILKSYGEKAREMIEENPYRLIDDFYGVGFSTADYIAQNLGIQEDASFRVEAACQHILKEAMNDGHLFLPQKILIQKCCEFLNQPDSLVKEGITTLAEEGKVFVDEFYENEKEDVSPAVFLAYNYYSEAGICKHLQRITSTESKLPDEGVDKKLNMILTKLHIELSQEQIEAVQDTVDNKAIVITGGPGTGKTTIINTVLQLFNTLDLTTLLAAPTGRAAKRISETTGAEAKTIHRLLEFNPVDNFFNRDEDNPLEADILIIDEASMIDNQLMFHLLKAVPDECHIILVGDVDQLPSVGPGNVLKDLIDSEYIHVVKLTKIFRQAEESKIITNSHKINQGIKPDLSIDPDNPTDFYFIRTSTQDKVLERVMQVCAEDLPRKFKLDPVSDIQVLAPMYRGTVGVSNLNEQLQQLLNPAGKEIGKGQPPFRIFDKVMQIRNNYEKEVFNGDIGRISLFDTKTKEAVVSYDDKTVRYELSELDDLTHAYAISVHKSQGSEYPVIVLPVIREYGIMLQRKLLYTALTRAKKMAVLLGSEQAISIAINNNRSHHRYTLLGDRLKAMKFL